MGTILNDEELVLRIHNTQDSSLFKELLNRYKDDVYSRAYIACHRDADKAINLAVDIFAEIWSCIISGKYRTPISNWIRIITNGYIVWQINGNMW